MKKSELIITLLLVVIAIIVTVFAFITKDKKEDKIIISNITINGIKLGDKMAKSRRHLVMDYKYKYEDNDVYFELEDDKVTALEFVTTESDGVIHGIADAKIFYKDTRLKTIEDFEKLLGAGKKTEEDEYETIEYSDEEATLVITNYKDKFINVEIKLNKMN